MAGKIDTIKNRRDFLSAAQGGKFIAGTLIVQITERGKDHPVTGDARIGYTVTKKMGNAVARNRIKRRLREAFRSVAHKTKTGHDYVIISRHKAIGCEFAQLVRDMEFAFSRITVTKNT